MYPSDFSLVKEYPDGTRWYNSDNNIPVQIFSGVVSREALRHAEQATDDIFAAHANDDPFCLLADLRNLQGLTSHIRQDTKNRFSSFPKTRKYYFALLVNNTLPNRLMALFLSNLVRFQRNNITLQFFHDPQLALAWLESQRAAASITG